jgi:pilus assembly protein CpaF
VISPTSPASAPAYSIVVHEKGGAERREPFERAEITVGRVQGNDLMLPKGNVSKRHARLLYRDGRFIVTDLNSTNGTYVNRRRITQATIVREGDRIYIGDFVLRIELAADADQSVEAGSGQGLRATLGSFSEELGAPGALRPAVVDDDDELTRVPAPPRLPVAPASSPVSSEAPARQASVVLNEQTGTHSVGRATEEGAGSDSMALRFLVLALVDRVVGALGPERFEQDPDAELERRVGELLENAWSSVSDSERAPHSFAPDRVIALARAELLEHGPLDDLLVDPNVSDIGIPRFDRIVVRRGERVAAIEPGFSSELSLRRALDRLARSSGFSVPEGGAFSCRLPGGTRLSCVFGPAPETRLSATLKKPLKRAATLEELVRRGTISRAMATFLQHCLMARVNLLLVGSRDSGAELLLGALAAAGGDGDAIWLSDAEPPEGGPSVSFASDAEAVKAENALRLMAQVPGARLVGFLSDPLASAALVEAVSDGADGVVAVRYAPTLRRALSRLPAEVAAARSGLGIDGAREWVAGAFEVALEIARLRDDRLRVLRVAELLGVSAGEIVCQDIFSFVMDRTAAGGAIEGTFVPSGTVPQVVDAMRARGAALESAIFSRPPSR